VNPVFADTFYWVARIHRKEAARAVRRIFTVGNVRVLPQSRDSFLAGLDLYEARPDKGYSLELPKRAFPERRLTAAGFDNLPDR
jgi:hypothetical protein